MNRLYFGDNLHVLRGGDIRDESIDLIYLDPPFNSNATYNKIFKTLKGQQSIAQIAAFEDTWHWGPQAELEFNELINGPNTDVAELVQALRKFLGENDMMAYLTMMANRLVALRSVLKPKGTIYLHCDPTASHYLKLVLDGVFGADRFRNEIIWQRSSPKGHAFTRFPSTHDVLLAYGNGADTIWNTIYLAHRQEYIDSHYGNVEPETGRRYQLDNLLNPNHDRPNLTYEFPPRSGNVRVWRWTKERMMQAWDEGRIVIPPKGGMPRYKRYLDEMQGTAATSVWTDIPPVNSQAEERLGYPTQKPLALLERIIRASSNEGDVVLDPFCGCGTAVHAAQKLKRQWIGIDVTHLAIATIENRLRGAFPGLKYEVHGTPNDIDGAGNLAERDKYQFQYWACSLVDAHPYQQRKKGADSGIDGVIYFQDDKGPPKKIVVSVKGGQNLSAQMIRELRGVVEREKAAIGLFVTLAKPTRPMRDEAVKAGYYTAAQGTNFPRLQLLTIEGLLNKYERPKYPDLSAGGHTFRKPRIEQGSSEQGDLFSGTIRPPARKKVESMLGFLKERAPARKATRQPSSRNGKAAAKTAK